MEPALSKGVKGIYSISTVWAKDEMGSVIRRGVTKIVNYGSRQTGESSFIYMGGNLNQSNFE